MSKRSYYKLYHVYGINDIFCYDLYTSMNKHLFNTI